MFNSIKYIAASESYSHYDHPAAAQDDDSEIVNNLLALARTLRGDIRKTAPGFRHIVNGLAKIMLDSSFAINNTTAALEVRRFGAELIAGYDDLDALIFDRLEAAETLISGAEI
tara:strand:- start:439 stop:780 length:342 start_codon:yes stop_codon:yes gene_type:complete